MDPYLKMTEPVEKKARVDRQRRLPDMGEDWQRPAKENPVVMEYKVMFMPDGALRKVRGQEKEYWMKLGQVTKDWVIDQLCTTFVGEDDSWIDNWKKKKKFFEVFEQTDLIEGGVPDHTLCAISLRDADEEDSGLCCVRNWLVDDLTGDYPNVHGEAVVLPVLMGPQNHELNIMCPRPVLSLQLRSRVHNTRVFLI